MFAALVATAAAPGSPVCAEEAPCTALATPAEHRAGAATLGHAAEVLRSQRGCLFTEAELLSLLGLVSETAPPSPELLLDTITSGVDAYYDGRLEDAQAILDSSLVSLESWSMALDARPEAVGNVQEGVLTLVRVYLAQDERELARAQIRRFDRIFPTTQPSPKAYPPDLLSLLEEARDARSEGLLRISADTESVCGVVVSGAASALESEVQIPLGLSALAVRLECGEVSSRRLVVTEAWRGASLTASASLIDWLDEPTQAGAILWPEEPTEVAALLRAAGRVEEVVLVTGRDDARMVVVRPGERRAVRATEGSDLDVTAGLTTLLSGSPSDGWLLFDGERVFGTGTDRTLEWVLGGSGLGVLAAGGALYIAARRARDEASDCAHGCGAAEATSRVQHHANLMFAADVVSAIGATLTVGAVTLWLVRSDRPDTPPEPPAWSVAVFATDELFLPTLEVLW